MGKKVNLFFVASIVFTLLISSFVFAYVVGDTPNFQVLLECPGKSSDLDISDGEITYLYYDYELEDPDTIVRDSELLTLTTNNPKSLTVPFMVDKSGTWTLTANMYFLTLAWDGSTFSVDGSGKCDTEVDQETVDPSGPVCGNNVKESGEDCDGTDLDDKDCADFGYDYGTLACSGCSFVFSGCHDYVCGNNIKEPGEECDGTDLDGKDCTDLGFGSGDLDCDLNCDFDTSLCVAVPECGNGIEEAGEECDDGNYYNHDDCVHCMDAYCGDGYYWVGHEECDDGDNEDGDGCSSICEFESSGEQCFAPIDVMLLIDRSGSMELDPDPESLQNAKIAAITFVNKMNFSKDEVGLASFNESATLDIGLTNNTALITNKINLLAAGGQTNIGQGIQIARDELIAHGGDTKAMILLSDGAPNVNESGNYCFGGFALDNSCAKYALNQSNITKDAGIEIFVIGLGVDALTETLLMQLATTPSNYYYAPSSTDLESIYLQIAEELCPCEGFDCSINSDDCNTGFCNLTSDQCEFEPKDYSTVCEFDGDLCTNDHCDGVGSCVVLNTVDCSGLDGDCQEGVCDPGDGLCYPNFDNYPYSTPCEADSDLCTIDHCDGAGDCTTYDSVQVPQAEDCRSFYCDPADGLVKANNYAYSTTCEADSDLCTIDHCDGAGDCVKLDDVDCSGLDDDCQEGVCDPGDGLCYPNFDNYPLSTPCEADLDKCTIDHCDGVGSCVKDYDKDCSYLNDVCQDGACDSVTGDCYPDYTNYPLSTYCETDDNICTIQHCDAYGNCVINPDAPLPPECLGDVIKDAKVGQAMPTSNFGLGRYMIVNPKQGGTDRAYIRIDASPLIGQSISSAYLKLAVYYTGGNAVGEDIEAWYCPDHDFDELTINWNNQPIDEICTPADTYNVPSTVVAGSPETWHEFDVSAETIDELATGDGLFTVVLKSANEGTVSDNSEYVQYLTKEYSEEDYRPKFEAS